MTTPFKTMTALCVAALAASCAPLGQDGSPAIDAGDAYVLAHHQHLARRYDAALKSYQAVLRVQPGHVGARNGLASLHAERGDYASAIGLWRELAASASGPRQSYLLRNLGHAYVLGGDHEAALGAFERACVLDPLDARGWRQLGQTLARLGQHARAELMLRQARALESHDLKADHAALARADVKAVDGAVTAAAPSAPEWDAVRIVAAGDGSVQLRRTGALAPAPEARPADVAPPLARVEYRNGNGVSGMAAALARKADLPGMRVVRLSNERGFKVQQSRIEYRPAFEPAARLLLARFPGALAVAADTGAAVDVRVVLGRDLVRGGASRATHTAQAHGAAYSQVTLPSPRADALRLAGLP